MAPAKKVRGAPASAQRERQVPPVKKLTRKEKHAVNSSAYKSAQKQVHQEVKALIAERTADWELKPEELRGKDDPILPTDKGTKVGRPSILYTKELDALLFELICVGTSLDNISAIKGTPGLSTMLRWLADDTHKFSSTYAQARQMVIPLYEDRALAATLNPALGVVKVKGQRVLADGTKVDIEETRETDNVERAKLVFNGYQWALGWMVPKKHGRNADPAAGKPNEQLEALFQALKTEAE